jgi:hypothetical protein
MATVANYLGLPFVTVCNAMLINREPGVPPYSMRQVIVEQRREWNLPQYQRREDAYSPLAQVCYLPEAFDFPRQHLPAHFQISNGPHGASIQPVTSRSCPAANP